MKPTTRTFIAVDAGPAVRQAAVEAIKRLRAKVDDVKWVEEENLHLTLKFLGEIPTVETVDVIRACQRAVESIEPFDLEMVGLGAFPDIRNARTIWLGSQGGREEMAELVERLESELESIGYPRERRAFQPHLTLGRARRGRRPSPVLPKLLEQQADTPLGLIRVDTLLVYSSELSRHGPKYEVLAECDFA